MTRLLEIVDPERAHVGSKGLVANRRGGPFVRRRVLNAFRHDHQKVSSERS